MILYQMSLIFHNKALFWGTVANSNKKDNMCKQLISTLFDQSTQSEQEKSSSCVPEAPSLGCICVHQSLLVVLKA